jgi:amino acid adenylation domain-containing protein
MASAVDLSETKRLVLERMLIRGGAPGGRESDAVTPRAADARAPISAEQRHIWLHAATAPEVPLYNEAITIHRRGAFDLATLENSLNEILRRHEIWRTSFVPVDGPDGADVEQIVQRDLRVTLPLIDLTSWPAGDREAEALRLATEDARAPIALTQAPLFRARVIKLAADDHRLHLTLHHIIFDGVSIYRVIVPELAAIYAAFAAGRRPGLAEPTLQYADYALWRARHVESDAVMRQLDHWRQELGGELPVLELPTDRPRAAQPTQRGGMATFDLPAPLVAALKAFSRAEGVTFYMTLLAAFKTLLFRYSGQTDIVVGGVTDTRRRPELEPVVGYFLNSLALRTRPSAALAFRDYLRQVRNTVLGALGASDLPFDRVVRALQPRRDPGVHPLFQVLFSVEPPVAPFPDGWDLTQMDVTVGGAKFDLYLELDERPDGMVGRFLYSTELFDAPTIGRMIGHWLSLLDGIAEDPGCALGALPLLTAAERDLAATWNATARELPPATVHGLFEAQARRTPDAVALRCGDATLSYAELDRRAGELARRLRAAGVGRETVVAVCLERSPALVAALLGVLKAGGAYLPLDPTFPAARLALILEDARPAALLTERRVQAALPPNAIATVLCDDGATAAGPSDPGFPPGAPEDLAYVLYTSGSTGRPKGVEVPHRAVVNLLVSMGREPGFTADDALLAVTTIAFDIAALEIFLPLISGGRVILADGPSVADPRRLAGLIAGCNVMQATPATWRALLEIGWTGHARLKILCGGEALPRELADRLLARGASVWNLYGPTETTIWSTVAAVEPGARPVSVGRPIANTSTYILDASGRTVPVGVTGELCIGGAGVARGYRGQPELTRARFGACPAAPGERLYRTGDIARWRADGTIEWLGRSDDQVKIRGFRVALGEIEAALAAHPAVAAAAVRAWRDRSGEHGLVGYIVARGDAAAPDAPALRRFLQQTLPDYLVPSRFVALDALPLTPNAKVDRKALPAPETRAGDPAPAAARPPRGDRQCRLAAIWCDVLGVPSVGARDNFFDLGGHSLLVTRLLRRIEDAFGRRLPMAVVFQAPTVEEMAALLDDDAPTLRHPRIVPFQTEGIGPPVFWLSPGPVFRPLVQALGNDQPFLGVALDAAELATLASPVRFADIAACLVRDIRAVQPHGPYYLGGWCTGGILAFEVAAQLNAAGETVAVVMLLHAVNPVQYRRIGRLSLALGKLRYHVGYSLSLCGWHGWRYAAARTYGALQKAVQHWTPACLPPEFDQLLDQAAIDYVPKPYGGDVVLLQPADRPPVLDYRAGWAEVVRGSFTAFDVPGTHRTVLDPPYVAQLGAQMRACLARVRAARAPNAAPAVDKARRLPRAIAIQPRGTRPPLLWLSPEPSTWRLAAAIGTDQPFVGIRLYPDDVRDLRHPAPLSAIARRYVAAIRAFQPTGPYYVGGWCVWGVVAFEVAAQLRAAGHDVGLVVLLHAISPAQYRATSRLALLKSKVGYHVGEMRRRRGRERWHYLAGRSQAALHDQPRQLRPRVGGPASFAQLLYHAAETYQPQPYGGAVALFQPESRPTAYDFRPGWAAAVRGALTSYDIPATHWTLLDEDNVGCLGATMNACLKRAQDADRPLAAAD